MTNTVDELKALIAAMAAMRASQITQAAAQAAMRAQQAAHTQAAGINIRTAAAGFTGDEIMAIVKAFKQVNPDADEQKLIEAANLYPPEPGEALWAYLDRLNIWALYGGQP